MAKLKLKKKMSKINLRIISKPHAHLQSKMKTSVKFQKNRNKTVEGVAHTMYILLWGEGAEGRTYGYTEGQKDGKPKTMSSAFLRKGGRQ